MALIWSVYWPNPERTGPDLTQMNRVVEVSDEMARMRAGHPFVADLPGDGTARWPTPDELAEYEAQQQAEQKADEATADGGDLTKLTKADLVKLAEQHGVDVPSGATKADIAALVEDARSKSAASGGSQVPGAFPQGEELVSDEDAGGGTAE